ncbi:MAG: macro domain-containing protein [Butyrivibrio sp.]|uniref:macro domain-containing protein n=1 Tax=Butyrivibrio sp. TaxID=28121 RepID=UPI001B0E1F3B|nr:macro domain-containing protein [Butyrivibrio sp.]MBO6240609.1 macro domain-containing protein [Butyrivibrio sp.]
MKWQKQTIFTALLFPEISTGVYGYPKKDAARVALKTVKEWLEANSDYDMEITIVSFSEEDYLIYQTVAAELS